MTMPTYNARTWQLDLDRPAIETTSNAPRKDPDWSFTDSHGHTHTWDSDTWHSVLDDPDDDWFYFDADGEEYNSPTHIECKLCSDPVEPGTLPPSPFRTYEPGPMTATLKGLRSDGVQIIARLDGAQIERIRSADDSERDAIVRVVLDELPDDRIISANHNAG